MKVIYFLNARPQDSQKLGDYLKRIDVAYIDAFEVEFQLYLGPEQETQQVLLVFERESLDGLLAFG